LDLAYESQVPLKLLAPLYGFVDFAHQFSRFLPRLNVLKPSYLHDKQSLGLLESIEFVGLLESVEFVGLLGSIGLLELLESIGEGQLLELNELYEINRLNDSIDPMDSINLFRPVPQELLFLPDSSSTPPGF